MTLCVTNDIGEAFDVRYHLQKPYITKNQCEGVSGFKTGLVLNIGWGRRWQIIKEKMRQSVQ